MKAWLMLLCLGYTASIFAHKNSESYLLVHSLGDSLTGQLLISVRDMDRLVDVDHNRDGNITLSEVKRSSNAFIAQVATHISAEQPSDACPLHWQWADVIAHADEYFVQLHWQTPCVTNTSTLKITYSLFGDRDTQHKVLMQMGEHGAAQIFATPAEITLSTPTKTTLFTAFLREGVWHIWAGYDHLLFLFCLLLPAAFTRTNGRWQVQDHAYPIIKGMLKLVTGFTLGHSVTLSLATLQWFSLPSMWVETIIAFSVLLAALNLRWPLFKEQFVLVTFMFGLIHGFGFASALAELTLSSDTRALSLLAFNLGVELGQIAVLIPLVPMLLHLRYYQWYTKALLPISSWCIAMTALFWLTQRLGFL